LRGLQETPAPVPRKGRGTECHEQAGPRRAWQGSPPARRRPGGWGSGGRRPRLLLEAGAHGTRGAGTPGDASREGCVAGGVQFGRGLQRGGGGGGSGAALKKRRVGLCGAGTFRVQAGWSGLPTAAGRGRSAKKGIQAQAAVLLGSDEPGKEGVQAAAGAAASVLVLLLRRLRTGRRPGRQQAGVRAWREPAHGARLPLPRRARPHSRRTAASGGAAASPPTCSEAPLGWRRAVGLLTSASRYLPR
jgi:hypothetical protein